jgi:hypothetical protein
MVIVAQGALTRVIREKQLHLALNMLRILRDDPMMTGWEAHKIAEKTITEIYAMAEDIDA